ncbi:hypothetical protein IM792_16155 [Mucilaginibacter sp. JRF]|uniref:hypothetical protein n=1 Tax=Mucilaginibacter sp. JRF TaxID=2780088 RepID=UPI0018827AAF|nr:hypothetical protein [Mucilaginibacter sp. JRF]MBE9585988.1 hypothetical protein [Mucilaginibacter sp. JRF]
MYFNFFRLSLILLLISGLYSCNEFIEPSIEKRQLNLRAPANNYQTNNYTVGFWWDEVEDALTYRLQIVRPSFDSTAALVADTVINRNTFNMTLDPGNYQWQVRAENGSSTTAFTPPRNLIILPGSLEEQTVTLLSPGNNTLTNASAINLQWNLLYGASTYRLQIDTASFSGSAYVYDQVIPSGQFRFSFPKDQTYQWRVRGQNDDGSELSKWSAIYNLSNDRTPPGAVTATLPDNNAQVQMPVTFSWASRNDAARYRFYLYRNNGSTLYSNTFPVEQTATSYTFNAGTAGERVYWKVTAVDAAGNEGAASELRNVLLQ